MAWTSANQRTGQLLSSAYNCAKQVGLIMANRIGNDMAGQELYKVVPTPSGRNIGKTNNQGIQTTDQSARTFVLKVAERHFQQVTGIKTLSSSSAEVYFDYVVKNHNSLGMCMFKSAISQSLASIRRGVGIFGKYDDGWRLEDVKTAGANNPWVPFERATEVYNVGLADNGIRTGL